MSVFECYILKVIRRGMDKCSDNEFTECCLGLGQVMVLVFSCLVSTGYKTSPVLTHSACTNLSFPAIPFSLVFSPPYPASPISYTHLSSPLQTRLPVLSSRKEVDNFQLLRHVLADDPLFLLLYAGKFIQAVAGSR